MSKQPDRQLVRLVAEAEASRLLLERLVLRGIEGEDLRKAIDARTAALEALSEHYTPVSDAAYVPAHDKHVKHNRRTKPAA